MIVGGWFEGEKHNSEKCYSFNLEREDEYTLKLRGENLNNIKRTDGAEYVNNDAKSCFNESVFVKINSKEYGLFNSDQFLVRFNPKY